MRSLALSAGLSALLATPALAGVGSDVLINEVDADQTSTDSVEFIELIAPGGTSLDGHFLLLYNGANATDAEYDVVDLSGQTVPADGFFVVGVAIVPNVDFVPSVFNPTNAIQNGADAVALWLDTSGALVSADWFGTDPTTAPGAAVLIDALVYDTSDSDDAVLLSNLGITGPQVNENENGAKDTESNGRCPDGGAAFDTGSYKQALPTPGTANNCSAPSAWSDDGAGLAGGGGVPLLEGTGDLSDGSANSVDLSGGAASATAALFLSIGPVTPIPFKGGTLVPVPFLDPIILATSATGDFSIPFVMPPAIPAGVEIRAQWAIVDAGAINGVALSNAILGVTP